MAGRDREVFCDINITPLTDIFLVLLIIMMVVAPMLDTTGLKLSVPSVQTSEDTKDEPKAIRLQIKHNGSQNQDAFEINQEAIIAWQLPGKLKDLKKDFPDGVIVETDAQSAHDTLAQALDAIQTAGIEKVAVTELATQATTSSEAP
ncbi:MAG: biopolymer transporter ExbD [Candidatus Melainabacteria bacterium]|nr:biopolymer transporter ExbD [Candidatus Melainabacteria bacterium]